MEPDHREDQDALDRPATDRPEARTERAALTALFTSEGLESVRDSHC